MVDLLSLLNTIDALFQLHANVVLAEDVLDYSVLFAEIADAYFEKELFADAKPIYELLGGDPAVRSSSFLRVCAVKKFARRAASIFSCEQLHACEI